MRRLNLILGLLAVDFMGTAHAEQSGEVRRVVHPSHPVAERIESGGSPVVRAIFSEVNCLGYIEGKTLLIAPYSGEGCTAHGLADEGVVRNPDRIVALTANLTLCFQGGNHHNSASALGRSAANRVDQILKWENRGEIPVFQPMKFELVNLKAGKAPGLKMPLELLAVADEVIK